MSSGRLAPLYAGPGRTWHEAMPDPALSKEHVLLLSYTFFMLLSRFPVIPPRRARGTVHGPNALR